MCHHHAIARQLTGVRERVVHCNGSVVVVTHSFQKCGGRDAFVPEVWWS
jgi:hypothetical protein